MSNRSAKKPTDPSKTGRAEIWIAVVCISLSNILSLAWLWSLVNAGSMP